MGQMGTISFSSDQFVGTTTEIVGYKSGIALSKDEAVDLTPVEYKDLWTIEHVRIRAEEYEELVTNLLYAVGNIPVPVVMPGTTALYHKYKGNRSQLDAYMRVGKLWVECLQKSIERSNHPDLLEFVRAAYDSDDELGATIAREIVELTILQQHVSTLSTFRTRDWSDELELKELFESEKLSPTYGKFIDQRFVDFLDHQFGKLGEINWRKFEALTAEFFDKQGWHVELGPGRNDGGIDIRVWPEKPDANQPATILVQCKRYAKDIEKTIVKALWSDVQWENAKSGLIVTTSRLSPGSQRILSARAYAIQAADRKTLRTWLTAMRSSKVGAFLAE
jgi:restriction system protein